MNVVARIARVFFDNTLPTNAAYAVKLYSENGIIKDAYANLYFFRKVGSFIKPILDDFKSIHGSWHVKLVAQKASSELVVTEHHGLSDRDLAKVVSAVAAELSKHMHGIKQRGRPATRERDESGKPVRKGQNPVKKQKAASIKPPRSISVNPQSDDETHDAEDINIDDSHIDELDGLKPEKPREETWNSVAEAESNLRKAFERPLTAFTTINWSSVWKIYKHKLPQAFIDKYSDKIEEGKKELLSRGIKASADIIETITINNFRV